MRNPVFRLWGKLPPGIRRYYYRLSGNFSPANLLLPDKSEVVIIQAGINQNHKMKLNLRHDRGYYLGIYESTVQNVLSVLVKPGSTVFILGAHKGYFVLAAARLAGRSGTVVAFEPNPAVRPILEENVSLNGYADRVLISDYALGDFDGPATFSLSLSDTQGRFADLPHVKDGNSVQVSSVRLDTYLSKTGKLPDLILIDVEHAEGRVLQGMYNTLVSHRPILVIEIHGDVASASAWETLLKTRYKCFGIPDMQQIVSQQDLTYGHYLCLPDELDIALVFTGLQEV